LLSEGRDQVCDRFDHQVSPGRLQQLGRVGQPLAALGGAKRRQGRSRQADAVARRGDAVRLRRYDDLAKVVGAAVPDFATYAPMMSRLIRGDLRRFD